MIIFSMRFFVDIGSHFGESIYKALNPELGFDKIFAYEPSSIAFQRLSVIEDSRLTVRKIALGSNNGHVDLFSSGLLGATTFSDKVGVSNSGKERVIVRSASEELHEILESGAEVFMKINCEGGELDILENLKMSGLIMKCTHLYVDWDARKVPSLAQRYSSIRSEVEKLGIDLVSSDSLPVSGWKGVELWLSNYKVHNVVALKRLEYKTFNFLPFRYRMREILKYYAPSISRKYVKFTKRIQKGHRQISSP
jgi:FkbM family methyltransferase